MLESTPVAIAVGAVLGFLSGLGVGGGSLLMLWLTLVLGMETAEARGINLLFFLPAALIALFFQKKQGSVEISKLIPGFLAGSVAAGAVAFFTAGLDAGLLKKGFGILLLFTGARELLYRPKT